MLHPRGARLVLAILILMILGGLTCPIDYAVDYSIDAGDHKGGTLFTRCPVGPLRETTARHLHIRRWKLRHFRTLTRQVHHWVLRNPPGGCMMAGQRPIPREVGLSVCTHTPMKKRVPVP